MPIGTSLYIYRSLSYYRKHSEVLPFPMHLQIQTKSLCNAQCPICPNSTLRGQQEQGIMTRELFENIAHQAADEPLLSTLWFVLQNEPLLDKRVFQWIRYFKSLNQKKRAGLCTNGELISEFELEEIVQSQLDVLIISLNAHTERTFNMINKGIEYKKVIENINFLLSHPIMKSKIVISFVLTKYNKKEIWEAVCFWSKKGVKTRVIFLTNRGGTLENYHSYKPIFKRRMNFRNIIKSRLSAYYTKNIWKECSSPFFSMCVLFNGDVILCCQDYRRSTIIGNVNSDLLQSIWNSSKFNEIRRLILEKIQGHYSLHTVQYNS